MYRDGKVVHQDYAEAVRWFRKAAGHGDLDAAFDLGVMYEEGQGRATIRRRPVGIVRPRKGALPLRKRPWPPCTRRAAASRKISTKQLAGIARRPSKALRRPSTNWALAMPRAAAWNRTTWRRTFAWTWPPFAHGATVRAIFRRAGWRGRQVDAGTGRRGETAGARTENEMGALGRPRDASHLRGSATRTKWVPAYLRRRPLSLYPVGYNEAMRPVPSPTISSRCPPSARA